MKNERRSNKDERIEELIRSLQKIKLRTDEIITELETLRVDSGNTTTRKATKFKNIIPKHLILKT